MLKYKIRDLRRKQNLTQSDFGRLINISASTIALWETGKREPDIKNLKKISEIFNVTTDYLLDNEQNIVESDNEQSDFNVIQVIGRNGDHKTFIVDDQKMKEIESIAKKIRTVNKN